MSKQLKQINLRLMNSSAIPLTFYRNSDQTNLMLLYNSKALKEKLDKILGKFQTQQRKFLQRNFSCGTYDSKDCRSSFLSFSQSTSPRQYFYWDSKVAQSISMKKNRKNETISSNSGGSTRHNHSHYRGFFNNYKRAYSVSDFTPSFKVTNFSQLNVKKQNIITDRRVIKLKQSDKKKTFKEFKDLTKYKNQQENISRTYNSGGLGFLNSKLFGNVFLRKKVLES